MTEHLAFGGTRGDAYQAIAELVVAASERGPVSWVTLGSPAVVCGVTTSIEAAAAARGRRTRRILAVSSLDLIASDLGLDVGRAGLTVLPALALVSCGARPDPRTGCIVMMVARAETALHVLNARLKPGALDRVAKALLEVYPESHPRSSTPRRRVTRPRAASTRRSARSRGPSNRSTPGRPCSCRPCRARFRRRSASCSSTSRAPRGSTRLPSRSCCEPSPKER